jgi:hypothetical protein
MKRHGLSDAIDIVDGDFTERSGMLAAQELLRRRRPTAVCAANDQSAIGLLDQLLRAGVDVPGDIAVAGYDDSVLARLAHIDLTTVSQEPRQQAERAVRAVVERLDENRQERLDVLRSRGSWYGTHSAGGARTGSEHPPVRRAVGLVVDAPSSSDDNRVTAAEVVVEPLCVIRADVDATVAYVPLALVADRPRALCTKLPRYRSDGELYIQLVAAWPSRGQARRTSRSP